MILFQKDVVYMKVILQQDQLYHHLHQNQLLVLFIYLSIFISQSIINLVNYVNKIDMKFVLSIQIDVNVQNILIGMDSFVHHNYMKMIHVNNRIHVDQISILLVQP